MSKSYVNKKFNCNKKFNRKVEATHNMQLHSKRGVKSIYCFCDMFNDLKLKK